MKIKKKILYVDMDDVTADFFKAANIGKYHLVDEGRMYEKNFFLNLEPVNGAQWAVRNLIRLGFDVWILTQPLADCFDSYTDKAKWIGIHFPELREKIIMTQDKGLIIGHYLIDDNEEKWKEKFEKNGGKFVHFPYIRGKNQNHRESWEEIVKFFESEDPIYF